MPTSAPPVVVSVCAEPLYVSVFASGAVFTDAAAIVSVMVIVPVVAGDVIVVVVSAALAVRLMPGSNPSSITNVRAMLKNRFFII